MIAKPNVNITLYGIGLNPIEEGLLDCILWAYLNTHGKLLELIMSLICLGVVHMVTHPYLLWYAILQKWHILFHVIRKSPLKNQVNHLFITVKDYMVSLKLLCQIEILNLLEEFGKAL